MNYAIGLDLGGTNVKGVAVTPQGRILAQWSTPTADGGGTAWRENVRRVFERLQRIVRHRPSFVGIAAPGLPDRDGRSIACMPGRLAGLEGLVWQEYLCFPGPVPVLNDAQAAILGEVWRGAARRSKNVFLLTLGTGVGGAAIVDGRLLRGHIRRAGHLGHISLNPHGSADITGTPGSLEDAIGDATIHARSAGRFGSTRALVEASRRGDAEARRIWTESVRALAAGIASLANVLDPELVVLGGGIVKAGAALFRPLRRFLDEFEWRPAGAQVRIVAAKLGDRAGTLGAAWHAINPGT
ncbi:MAG: ROK family protein [Limisphaerales bacterium]